MKTWVPRFALPLSLLACRPVIAIGWGELVMLAVIMLFLAWPLLVRVYRVINRMQQEKEDEKEGSKQA
ncbi:MAG: hypothetical protein Kow002_03050 [Anaerolineales bacterium]